MNTFTKLIAGCCIGIFILSMAACNREKKPTTVEKEKQTLANADEATLKDSQKAEHQ